MSITPLLLILWGWYGIQRNGCAWKRDLFVLARAFLATQTCLLPCGGCGLRFVKLAIGLDYRQSFALLTMTFDNFGLLCDMLRPIRGSLQLERALTKLYLNHPIFVNAGTFVIFLLLAP